MRMESKVIIDGKRLVWHFDDDEQKRIEERQDEIREFVNKMSKLSYEERLKILNKHPVFYFDPDKNQNSQLDDGEEGEDND